MTNNKIQKKRENSLANKKSAINSLIKKEIKNKHFIKLDEIASHFNITRQRASILLKQFDIDIKSINNQAFQDYENKFLNKFNKKLKANPNFLSFKTFTELYEKLDYKFTRTDFFKFLRKNKIRETIPVIKDNSKVFKIFYDFRDIDTSKYSSKQLYDMIKDKYEIKENSFRTTLYSSKLPFIKKHHV